MPKVSVIVPIYNAGSHLNICLDSLVRQTLQDIEIILISDCPTDGSEKIAASYAIRYPNIKLIQNPANQHIGLSRNTGLEIATGEYIGFSDHDDFCLPGMFEELYREAKNKQADVILSKIKSLRTVPDPDIADLANREETNSYALSARQCFLELISGSQKIATGLVYTHLYRKQFLEDHKIRFADTRYHSSEDQLFNIEVYNCLIEHQGTVIYQPKIYYYHLLHQSNTGSTIAYRELKKNIAFLDKIHSVILSSTSIPQTQLSQQFALRIVKNLYTSWRYEMRYKGLKAFRNLNLINPPLRAILRQHYKIYNSQLSVCKNCFALLLKLFYT